MNVAITEPSSSRGLDTARIGSEPYLAGFKRAHCAADTESNVTRRILSTALISAAAVAALLGIPANADDPTPTATASPAPTMVETTRRPLRPHGGPDRGPHAGARGGDATATPHRDRHGAARRDRDPRTRRRPRRRPPRPRPTETEPPPTPTATATATATATRRRSAPRSGREPLEAQERSGPRVHREHRQGFDLDLSFRVRRGREQTEGHRSSPTLRRRSSRTRTARPPRATRATRSPLPAPRRSACRTSSSTSSGFLPSCSRSTRPRACSTASAGRSSRASTRSRPTTAAT